MHTRLERVVLRHIQSSTRALGLRHVHLLHCRPLPRRSLPLAGEILLYDDRRLAEDLQIVSRNRLAEKITGGLSWPSKMPGPAWGISATRCKVGSVLAEKPGTTCSECYVTGGRYAFPAVQAKLEERYRGLFSPLWVPSMVLLLNWFCERYFRWMDSGDLQGINHFKNICTVARHTPHLLHWLPSREAKVIRACKDDIPDNLVVRLSATMIDGPPPKNWDTTSTVYLIEPRPGSFPCEAHANGNRCGSCRACWDPAVQDVSYPLR